VGLLEVGLLELGLLELVLLEVVLLEVGSSRNTGAQAGNQGDWRTGGWVRGRRG